MRTDAAAQVGPPGTRRMALSVVIAASGDAEQLQGCLAALAGADRRGLDLEIIVVAGDGKGDGLDAVAEAHGATLIRLTGTRGARFAAGAKAATAEWVLLLRAQTRLDRGWDATVMVFTAGDRNRERAGFFPLKVLGSPGASRRMRWRNLWLKLPSGAQGMIIRRRFLVHLGGIADLERGEDLVLARTLGLKRMAMFDVAAQVDAGDWPSGAGPVLIGLLRLILFRLYVPARWLQRWGD